VHLDSEMWDLETGNWKPPFREEDSDAGDLLLTFDRSNRTGRPVEQPIRLDRCLAGRVGWTAQRHAHSCKGQRHLEGTPVLNIINRDSRSPRIVAHEAHVLLQMRSQGDSITFQVKRIDRSAEPMEFTVERTAADAAKIHCLNCGDDAPTVEMTKLD